MDQLSPPSDSPAPRPPFSLRSALTIAAVVALISFATALASNLWISFQDPYERAAEEIGAEIVGMPEFVDRYGDLDEDEAFRRGAELGMAAIPRLSDAELGEWLAITRQLLDAVDTETCAAMILGTADADAGLEAAKSLDLETYSRYLQIVMGGIRLELTDARGAPPPTRQEVDAALVQLSDTLGTQRLQEVGTIFTDPTGASGQEICSAGRDFFAGLTRLDAPSRGALIRMVTNPSA